MVGVVAEISDGSNRSPMAAVRYPVAVVAEWAAVAADVEDPVQYRVHREYSSTRGVGSLRGPMDDATLA